jgi:hypothetical protein
MDATPAKPAAMDEDKVPVETPVKENVAEEAVIAPKYVRLTEEAFNAFQAAAAKTVAIEAQISKLFGTTGDMQQIVKKLQSQTPTGVTVALPDDVVSEMEADFPEIAGHFRKGLEKALKGIRGTGASPTPDHEATEKAVRDLVISHEVEALNDAHPTWRDIVGAVADGHYDEANEFRQWLGTQDAGYQVKVNSTNSAAVISRAIDRFMQSKAPLLAVPTTPNPPKVAARTDRIQGAIKPKGDGGHAPPANTSEDDFAAGFNSR